MLKKEGPPDWVLALTDIRGLRVLRFFGLWIWWFLSFGFCDFCFSWLWFISFLWSKILNSLFCIWEHKLLSICWSSKIKLDCILHSPTKDSALLVSEVLVAQVFLLKVRHRGPLGNRLSLSRLRWSVCRFGYRGCVWYWGQELSVKLSPYGLIHPLEGLSVQKHNTGTTSM